VDTVLAGLLPRDGEPE